MGENYWERLAEPLSRVETAALACMLHERRAENLDSDADAEQFVALQDELIRACIDVARTAGAQ